MFRAGDVVVFESPDVRGPKRRPGVVISSDLYHENRPDVIVALVTIQTVRAIGPTDCILLDWAEAGLRRPSACRAFINTRPLNLVSRIGRLTDRDWQGVCQTVNRALSLNDVAAPDTEDE